MSLTRQIMKLQTSTASWTRNSETQKHPSVAHLSKGFEKRQKTELKNSAMG